MNGTEKKKICISGLVLGIVGLVFSLGVPAVTYSCSITGLVIAIKRRRTHRSAAAIALNIVAISLAAINSICGIIMTLKMYNSENDKNTAKDAERDAEKETEE